MKTKIKWFKEVLELEPGSKVFFPLAKLYFEDGAMDEAVSTLRQGLERNPDHLEARILLIEVLSRLGEHETALEEVETVAAVLSNYPSFWRAWAHIFAPKSKDGALALSFLAAQLQGKTISWPKIMEKGIESLVGDGMELFGAAETSRPAVDEASVRTKTMARLLADQGDYRGALDIYEELAETAAGPRRDELLGLAGDMRVKLDEARSAKAASLDESEEEAVEDEGQAGKESAKPLPGKERLLSTLEALAARLEARAAL